MFATKNEIIKNTSWNNFLNGEAELECQTQEEAEILMAVCQEHGIVIEDYIQPSRFQSIPFWYVKGGYLTATQYSCEYEYICALWSAEDFIANHYDGDYSLA